MSVMSVKEQIKNLGLEPGSIHLVPVSWAAQNKSPIPFVDTVRVKADSLGLKGSMRVVKITDIEEVSEKGNGTYLTIMGVLRNKDGQWSIRKVPVAIFHEAD